MTVVRIHDDGWLALPAAFRRTLGLGTNAVLEAELVDGTIVLRPATATRAKSPTEIELEEASEPSTVIVAPAVATAPTEFEIEAGTAGGLPPAAKRKPR